MLIELARLSYVLLRKNVHCFWHSRTPAKVLELSGSLAIHAARCLGGSLRGGLAVTTMRLPSVNFASGLAIRTACLLGGNFGSGGLGHGTASCCFAGPREWQQQTWREKPTRIECAFLLALP